MKRMGNLSFIFLMAARPKGQILREGQVRILHWGAKPYHDGYGYNVPDRKWTRIENSF
jgi:hypothetical protein